MIQIHISFNPFKWIFKSKSIFLDFKFNPFNWIWIRYALDTFLDYPNCTLGWVLTWPDSSWAKTIRAYVEQNKPEPMSSRSGPGRCRVSGSDRYRVVQVEADFELNEPRPILSRAGPDRCRVERVRAIVTDPDWCWVEWARADYKIQSIMIQIHISFNPFKWIYLKSKSIFWILNPIHLIGYGLDTNWIHFWIIQIAFWVGFWLGPIQLEPRQSGPMSSRAGPNRCRVV